MNFSTRWYAQCCRKLEPAARLNCSIVVGRPAEAGRGVERDVASDQQQDQAFEAALDDEVPEHQAPVFDA